jgi:hypothetical protein
MRERYPHPSQQPLLPLTMVVSVVVGVLSLRVGGQYAKFGAWIRVRLVSGLVRVLRPLPGCFAITPNGESLGAARARSTPIEKSRPDRSASCSAAVIACPPTRQSLPVDAGPAAARTTLPKSGRIGDTSRDHAGVQSLRLRLPGDGQSAHQVFDHDQQRRDRDCG